MSKDQLREVSELSGVMDDDFMDLEVMRECIGLLQNWEKLESKNAIGAFLFLKRNTDL